MLSTGYRNESFSTSQTASKSKLNIGSTDKAPLSSDLSDLSDDSNFLEGSEDAPSSVLDGTTDLNQALAEAETIISPFVGVPLGTDLSNQGSFEVASGSLTSLYTSNSDAFSAASSTQLQQSTSLPGPALEYLVIPAPTATINVTYNGFTPQAQAAFQYAVDIWESLVSSPVTIQVQANFTPLGSGILGSAGPTEFYRDFTGAPVANTFYPVALANSRRGADLNPNLADINANFSSNFTNWYFGTDGNTPAGQFDFATVVLHELCHGLGFLGSMDVNSNGQGSWGVGSGFPFIYDRFNENGAGQNLVNAFPNNSTALGTQLTSNNVFFNGANANAANGGRPRLYAPSTWDEGSSNAHLDEATYSGTINGLMTPFLSPGEVVHQPGAIGFGMFRDMGWNMNTQGWIYGTPGNDSLGGTSAAQNMYGLEGGDTLNGFAGNDFIDGGAGADSLIGGLGDDTFVVDNPLDFGIENAGEGTDTYISSATSFQMDANVENLTMVAGAVSATGTSIANTMTGNSANNILDGAAGNDRMIGGLGDDTYIVDNSLDFGIENAGEGTDNYQSSATSFQMDANVENLTMLAGAVSAFGTSIANTMTGNSANNTLDGAAGNDTLDGSTGDDSLFGGADSDILKGNVGNDFVDGGSGNDDVTGGANNDVLVGGSGNDKLTGALANDKFLYDTGRAFVKADVGRDTITDLDRKAGSGDTVFDQIVLDKTTFTSLNSIAGVGFSVSGEFKIVTSDNAAKTSSGEIVYNKTNDKLFYNQNRAASGFGTGDLFATLTGITSLAAIDFLIQV